MSFLRSRFVQAVVILVVAFLVLRFGIRPPAPWSVIEIYMAVVLLAVLLAGISYLVKVYDIAATDPGQSGYQSLLSMLVAAVFGKGFFYYLTMASIPFFFSSQHRSDAGVMVFNSGDARQRRSLNHPCEVRMSTEGMFPRLRVVVQFEAGSSESSL